MKPYNNLMLLEEDINLAPNYDADIDGLSGTGNVNYSYNALGNLTQDLSEEIEEIKWNAYGKVVEVLRTSTCQDKPDLVYVYDAFGQRIKKIVKKRVAGVLSHEKDWQETFYVRDAQGNVMAMYNHTSTFFANNYNYVNQSFSIAEWNLYGSSRLGTRAADKVTDVIFLASRSYNWIGNTVTNEVIAPTASFSYKKYRLLGAKTFELTNHLGNVITTISDRKLMVQDAQNLGYVHHYTPKILSIGEQYAFGMSMPGRTFSVEDYRYGFCSKEKDNEIKGEGNSLDYGARIYDSRTARWLSIDPYSSKYSGLSPFAYCANSPIVFKDPDGKDILIYYKDSQGLDAPVPYKYGSGLIIPDNIFVRKTILTLMAISENPDSKSLIDEIANDADYEFRILESPGATTSSPSAIEDWKIYVIDYNPSNGLYEDGTNQILSPFIAFFHEFGHGLDYRSVRKNASKGLTGSAAQNAEVKAGQIWANIQLDPINDPTWHSIKEQTTIEKYENPLANYFNQLIRTSYVNGYFSTFQFYNPLDTKLNQNHGRTIGCGDVERAPTETTPFSNSKEIDLK